MAKDEIPKNDTPAGTSGEIPAGTGTDLFGEALNPPFNPSGVTVRVKTVWDAVSELEPPDYTVEGLIQKRRLYSLTAMTGSGKTTLMVNMALAVTDGKPFFGMPTKQGRCLYLIGENPDDTLPRFCVAAKAFDHDLENSSIIVTTEKFDLASAGELIADKVAEHGPVDLVFIDTGPAFFAQRTGTKDGENSNDDMLKFAHEMRDLITTLPGNPTVIAAMHPNKRPMGKEDVIPRGGSAFLNEVDGNFSIWTEDGGRTAELSHAGKLRGPHFEPIPFKNVQTSDGGVLDADENPMLSVYAELITPEEQHAMDEQSDDTRMKILRRLYEASEKGVTIATICKDLGLVTSDGKPKRSTVAHRTKKLKDEGMAEDISAGVRLTPKGRKYAKSIGITARKTDPGQSEMEL